MKRLLHPCLQVRYRLKVRAVLVPTGEECEGIAYGVNPQPFKGLGAVRAHPFHELNGLAQHVGGLMSTEGSVQGLRRVFAGRNSRGRSDRLRGMVLHKGHEVVQACQGRGDRGAFGRSIGVLKACKEPTARIQVRRHVRRQLQGTSGIQPLEHTPLQTLHDRQLGKILTRSELEGTPNLVEPLLKLVEIEGPHRLSSQGARIAHPHHNKAEAAAQRKNP
ncbi:MAG: hypothetical protein HYZ81_10200 [Nitrospinae bacterium]|nr:hypothetical protein [Nitrospinota bacterium]